MRFHHNNSSGASVPRSRRQTTGRRIQKQVKITILGVAVVFAVAGFAGIAGFSPVKARDYDAEIRALQKQIDSYNEKASELSAQADTLQGKINELQNQQAAIQAQIDLSSAEKAQLEQQIAETEARIKAQSKALSENLKSQYYSSQTSALDILMNSDSVSDYVDRQTRQQAMSDQITDTVKQIQADKAELEKKKAEVEKVIERQNAQKQDLAESQAEQQSLLDQTQGQEAKFQELVTQTEEKKAQVQREQQDAIRRYQQQHGSSVAHNSQCGGGYPFCTVTPDTSQYYNGFISNGNARECVNYVQWRIFQLTGRNERHGHAGSWADVANSNAKENTVAIMGYDTGLPYGHVAWVEKVGSGDHAGQVYISEYNWSPYSYTERWVNISAFTGGFYDPL